jgi:hypothetical protein
LLAAAKRDGDIDEVMEKVELALFLDGRLLPRLRVFQRQVSILSPPESARGRVRLVGGRNSLSDWIWMARLSIRA